MNHTIDLVIQNKINSIVNEINVEPECVISPSHKLISFSINTWKSETIRKTITYRVKTNFDSEKFIEDSIKEIRERNLSCECNLDNNQSNERTFVNCFTTFSNEILKTNYDNRCPEVTKQIVVKENAKWYNNELREAKKRVKKKTGR